MSANHPNVDKSKLQAAPQSAGDMAWKYGLGAGALSLLLGAGLRSALEVGTGVDTATPKMPAVHTLELERLGKKRKRGANLDVGTANAAAEDRAISPGLDKFSFDKEAGRAEQARAGVQKILDWFGKKPAPAAPTNVHTVPDGGSVGRSRTVVPSAAPAPAPAPIPAAPAVPAPTTAAGSFLSKVKPYAVPGALAAGGVAAGTQLVPKAAAPTDANKPAGEKSWVSKEWEWLNHTPPPTATDSPFFIPGVAAAALGGGLGGWHLIKYLANKLRRTAIDDAYNSAQQDFNRALLMEAESAQMHKGAQVKLAALDSFIDYAYEAYKQGQLSPAPEKRAGVGAAIAGTGIGIGGILWYLAHTQTKKKMEEADANKAALRLFEARQKLRLAGSAPRLQFRVTAPEEEQEARQAVKSLAPLAPDELTENKFAADANTLGTVMQNLQQSNNPQKVQQISNKLTAASSEAAQDRKAGDALTSGLAAPENAQAAQQAVADVVTPKINGVMTDWGLKGLFGK